MAKRHSAIYLQKVEERYLRLDCLQKEKFVVRLKRALQMQVCHCPQKGQAPHQRHLFSIPA